MRGLLGCTGSKQLCSDGGGWQARGMQVSMPCGGFRVQHLALPSPRQVINALQNYTQLGFYFQAELEAEGDRGDCGGSHIVRSVRESFWEALGGGAQRWRAVPLPAGRMEGSDGPALDKKALLLDLNVQFTQSQTQCCHQTHWHVFTKTQTLFLIFVLFVCSSLQRRPILSTESPSPHIT